MVGLPPGPLYLLKVAPGLALPPLATYGALHWLESSDILHLPTWAIVALVASAKPAQYIAELYYHRIRNWVKARKVGARLVPHVEERWPYFGGISIIQQLSDGFKNGYVGETIPGWAEKYGNFFELRLLSESQIWTIEPEHIKAILATQFDNFEKGTNFTKKFDSFLGTGVFNSDGSMWKFHRSLTRPFFNRERVSDFDIFNKHSEEALALAKARLAEGYALDFQDLVSRFTLDSACQFLFGEQLKCLEAGIPYPGNADRKDPAQFTEHPSGPVAEAFSVGLNEVTLRSIIGEQWALREFWADMVKPHREMVDSLIDPMLEKALKERFSNKEKTSHEGETVLSAIIPLTQDKAVIKDALVNLLVAGRDTTASCLTFCVYMMAEYPHIAERLRKEILAKVGETGRPSYDDIRDMKYLRAFINEVLRLYPPVPFDIRASINDTVFTSKDGSQPLFIPRKTQIGYAVWSMHRRKDLWGPDAEEFDPDRWLDERLAKYFTPNPFIFLPFNAGPRICLGQQFAYHEISFFLIRLLQQFSQFELARDSQPLESLPPAHWAKCSGTKGREKVWPAGNLTLFVKGGLWVRMK
ncbi:cytochrome P450 monooxygenase pc-3 [Coprinopsis marcescibilis]|uniref:Cytochrome P450 monooxygenase pc-3 n=1 Tax=Coprinopsis marcescibilis TaxID=230819 RepID=A0A5C3KJL7_COPMA|nr:cytochrome P450 monooxygenase pc-3 [Coprinopsis marcescibilis]